MKIMKFKFRTEFLLVDNNKLKTKILKEYKSSFFHFQLVLPMLVLLQQPANKVLGNQQKQLLLGVAVTDLISISIIIVDANNFLVTG